MNEDLFIIGFLRYEIKHALCLGHDRNTPKLDKDVERKEAFDFMKTSQFDLYCDYVGINPDYVRRLTYSRAMQEVPEGQMVIEMERV